MKVRLSASARSYLLRETAYLRQHSPAAAKALVTQMAIARRDLSAFRNLGFEKDAPPLPGLRRPIVGDDDVGADEIQIVSVRHGRQMPLEVCVYDDFDYEAEPPDSR